jgi:hypothetical protein
MAVDGIKLDLDSIEPQSAEVVLNGKTYAVKPPTLAVMVKLSKLGKQFEQSSKDDSDSLILALESFTDIVKQLIPDLDENQGFTLKQSVALMEFITSMVVTPDQEMLKAEGLTPTDIKKNPDTVS